ncbi:MAG TPA: hypothetical protein VD994_00460 [Prosthecobacter sp.]|nr:hypothetical protein [Prosthecobacter sp.]
MIYLVYSSDDPACTRKFFVSLSAAATYRKSLSVTYGDTVVETQFNTAEPILKLVKWLNEHVS